jgi:hypothetical protein
MKTLTYLDPETGEAKKSELLETSTVWKNRFQEKNAKTQYFFLAAMPDNPIPVFFRVSGLSFKRATRFLNQARFRKMQLYDFITKVSVDEESTKFGKKYVLDFQITDRPVPEKWKDKAAQTCRHFIETSQNLLPDGK